MSKNACHVELMVIDPASAGPRTCTRRLLANIPATSRPILVAVSGGSDSVGLLIALHEEIAYHPGHKLVAVTVDHGLRQNSKREAQDVAILCADLGIPHHIDEWRGEKPATGLQAAARSARYRLLATLAEEIDAAFIVTGHNANDQAETIAMRRARSASGALGLAGMAPGVLYDNRIWILRPFLDISRQSIRNYLVGKNIGWMEDPTNADIKYERARIRPEIAPSGIEKPEVFFRRQQVADAAADFLDHALKMDQEHIARITMDSFQTDQEAHRLAVLSVIATMGGCQHRLGRDSAGRVFQFLAGKAKRMTAGRCVLDRRRDGVYIYRENRALPRLALDPGQSIVWDGRYKITNFGVRPRTVQANPIPSEMVLEGFSPDAILERASLAIPCISQSIECPSETDFSSVLCEPVVAPYATFLACFDLKLASALAKAIGAPQFLDLPTGLKSVFIPP